MLVEGAFFDSGIKVQCVRGGHVLVGGLLAWGGLVAGYWLGGGGRWATSRGIRASQHTFSSLNLLHPVTWNSVYIAKDYN